MSNTFYVPNMPATTGFVSFVDISSPGAMIGICIGRAYAMIVIG